MTDSPEIGTPTRSATVRYAAAAAATLVAVGLRASVTPIVGNDYPFATLFGATAFAVWFGGRRAAALTAIVGYIACDLLFVEPTGLLSALTTLPGLVGMLTYALSCGTIVALGRGMLVARRRAEQGEAELIAANRVATRRADELQALFDAAPIAVWVAHDPECRVVTANRFATGLIGGTREWAILERAGFNEATGFTLQRAGAEVALADRPLQRAARGEEVASESFDLAIESMAPIPLNFSAVPLRDERGEIRGAIAVASDLTEQRRSSAAAQAAERLLRLITDNMPVLISYIDRDFRYQLVNGAYETWFRTSQADIVGRPVREVVGEAAWERLSPWMHRALGGEAVSFEDEVEYKYLGRRWINAAYVPHVDSHGQVTGFAVLVTDLTERHRIEEAVRRSEQSQRLLVAMHDSTRHLHDPSAVLAGMMSRIGQFFGVERAVYATVDAANESLFVTGDYTHGVPSIAGRHVMQHFGAAAIDALTARQTLVLRDVATDGRTAESVATYHAIGVSSAIAVPLVKEGQLRALLAIARAARHDWSLDDIWLMEQVAERTWVTMESALAEQALRESRDVLAMAMRGGSMGAWSRDVQTNHVWWSRELEELFGLSAGAFEGTEDGFFAHVHEDDRALVSNAVEHALRHGEDYSVEFRFLHASGEWRWMEGRGRGVRSREDGRMMLYGLGIDITERRRTDEALKEADRQKDEFLAVLAHELRNPLAPIRNAAAFLRQHDRLDPSLRSAREIIDRQVHHLVRLVDDLLDVSRISRGKINLQRERVALAVIVGNAVEASRPMIHSLGHELTVSLPPVPVLLDADLTRLSQVLTNLLNNSAKYTPPGGRITLNAQVDGERVVICVQDDGIGIPSDMLPRIFRMFTQVDQSLERSAGGLGIGLTLVERLVALHDGRVEARSAGAGLGSEFIVNLPLHPEQEIETPAASEANSPLASSRILIVDDNIDSADSLAMMLRHLGHEVHTAYDGVAGVESAARLRPSILLLDIGLPLQNGYEVARSIRLEPWGADILIVAISGWGQEEDRRRSREAGFDHHLVKPVDHAVLLAYLGQHRPAVR